MASNHSKPTYIISDEPENLISDKPEEKRVYFNFDAYARTFADLIANKENKTPLVIGIYGPWGSGKTTLMKTVKALLETDYYTAGKVFRGCRPVWFTAWKYAQEEQILAALIEEIFRSMRAAGFFKNAKAGIEKLIKRFNIFNAFGIGVKQLIKVDPAKIFDQLEYKKKLGFYDSFQDFFDRLIWTYTRRRPKWSVTEEADDTEGVLVIFIDDLDRCPQPRIVQVLETIKLFMDKKGCVFVIGADSEIIETALKKDFEPEGARRFMEKIVQVTFRLPHIPTDGFSDFIENIAPRLKAELTPHLGVILPAVRNNPRQFKRFLNDTYLLSSLLANRGEEIKFDRLIFWNVLTLVCPPLIRDLRENPATMHLLDQHVKKILEEHAVSDHWELSPKMLAEVPDSLHLYLQDKRVVDIVSQFKVTSKELTLLATLSRTVAAEENLNLKASADGASLTEHVPGEVESQKEMADIPAGGFLYGHEKEKRRIDIPFLIDIYPVTNWQFKIFIEEKGYENEAYWSAEGWQWRNNLKIFEPAYRHDKKWNPPDHPVVGVSWHEADAFARWAGKALPTEQQWERAARGTDGLEYPWGDAFDKEKCNTNESGIGRTSRVTRFPNGVSPDKCYDMTGNVWEWTQSKYDEKRFVLKGCCWGDNQSLARCATRLRNFPTLRSDGVGFRCVRVT